MNAIEITVSNNGSLKVAGKSIVLKDAAGVVYDLGGREQISLCRCGQSKNKPFCDGSHREAGFQSTVQATALPPK